MKLVNVPEELELVKMIFSKYLEFRSLSQVLTWTLKNNIKSKAGADFKNSSLKRILNNPVYAIADEYLYDWFSKEGVGIASPKKDFNSKNGMLLHNKHNIKKHKWHKIRDKEEWIIVVGKHQGIIPSSDWVMVQELLEQNKSKAPRYENG